MGTLNFLLCIWTLTQSFTSIDSMYDLTTTCEFGTAFDGGSCTMTCDTGTPKTEVQWVNGTVTTSVDNSNCAYTGSLPTDYTGACPTSTTYTLTINKTDFCRDTWSWQCTDPLGAPVLSNKANVNVTVALLASSLNINLAGSTIECTVICNPPAVLRLYQIQSASSHFLKYVEPDSSNACPDAKGMKTELQYDITDTNSTQYYCQATNDLVEMNSSVILYAAATTTPEATTTAKACLCQCACTCIQACRIVLIIISIVLAIEVASIIVFIVVFCVKHIKNYNDQYRCAIFIGVIVVFVVAIACTIVVFVLAPPVEKPPDEGQDCCCSSCDPDGDKNKKLCNELKISAAIISILVAVMSLIIIIIILIVWICPGKCGTDKLLNWCNHSRNSVPRGQAGPGGGNKSNADGTPLNTVTPEKPKTKPVEKNTTDAGGNKKGSSKVSVSEVVMTNTPMLSESPYEIITDEEKKAPEEENKNLNENGKEMERNIYVNEPGTEDQDGMKRL